MISVIGGSGFIGRSLLAKLLVTNDARRLKVVDKNVSEDESICRQVWADVREVESLRSALAEGDIVINLAAEHRDDVYPVSLYEEVNVVGAKNICAVAREKNINTIVFTSSVAVYGESNSPRNEEADISPSTPYGLSKANAERVYIDWQLESPKSRKLVIVRPTAVFGHGNRGNIYALCKQVAENKFVHIGSGNNKKSLAYVENLASFLAYSLRFENGIMIHNYVDKPDFDMNKLIEAVASHTGVRISSFRFPYSFALFASYLWLAIVKILRLKSSITPNRIRKYSANTVFESNVRKTNFSAAVEIKDALKLTVESEFGKV